MSTDRILFKIWNGFRTKKTTVVLDSADSDLYEKLVLKASEKLQIDGSQLVLETDGTVIDENEALVLLRSEIFILLQRNELWTPLIMDSRDSSISTLPSTITQVSSGTVTSEHPLIVFDMEQVNEIPALATTQMSAEQLPQSVLNQIPEMSNIAQQRILNSPETVVSEDFWRTFEIPWDKLPNNILYDIKSGKRGKHIEDEVLSLILREMRSIQTRIPLNHFRIILHKIIEKSPKTFQDIDDDGVILGDGTSTLLLKLKDRNNYKNVLAKRRSNVKSDDVPTKKKRMTDIQIEDKSQKENETPIEDTDIEAKMSQLNEKFSILSDEELHSLLEVTYPRQRIIIKAMHPIEKIRRLWPWLLHGRVLSWHYEELMGHALEQIESAMNLKIDGLLNYLHHKKIIPKIPDGNEKTEKYIELLKGLSTNFKEVFEYILKNIESLDEVKEVSSLRPCIVHVKDREKYYVVIEKNVINEGTPVFLEAFKQFYASFFVFNLKYPEKAPSTLELVQRYFMKTHPNDGTKANTTRKNGVIRFLKSFSNFVTDNRPE